MSDTIDIGKQKRLLIWQVFKGYRLQFSIICGPKEYRKWKLNTDLQ
jgi:hypothetical protein